jgi:predicted TIM-barrel fold metal-dependent hydrolase
MNVGLDNRPTIGKGTSSVLAIADCDIHPSWNTPKQLYPYLSRRWQEHLELYGTPHRHGLQKGTPYPKGNATGQRADAWPPNGGRPGTDLEFMRTQLLDANNVELGILNATGQNGQGFQNLEFGAAFCSAVNDWLIAEWTSKDERLKAAIVVPYEDGPAAAAEIDRRAGDKSFVQVLLLTRTAEPLGRRHYWPIYEAAERHNLPIGIHAFGYGGYPITGGGWPSYYIEEMVGHAQTCQSLLTSMIVEGVFERYPGLRLLLTECGFGWVPGLGWRLDKLWKQLKSEVPHLKHLPSEYIKRHVWLTTQPMEEPEPRERLLDAIGWIGWDRLLFATDYPHWDYDDPAYALPLQIPEARRQALFRNNARDLYGL